MLLARPFAYPAQWGDLGGWITGLSTVALALVTLVGLQVQRNEIRRQQGELEAQQEQINEQRQLTQQQTAWITTQLAAQRKAQARRIHADGSSVSAELPGIGPGNYQYVRVTNESERPIYELSCVWRGGSQEEKPHVLGHVNMPTTGMDKPRIALFDAMPHAMLRPTDKPLDFVFSRQPVRSDRFRYVIMFTDDDGIPWELDAQQRLTEVLPAPEPDPEP